VLSEVSLWEALGTLGESLSDGCDRNDSLWLRERLSLAETLLE